MKSVLVLALSCLLATTAQAGGWEGMTVPTAEGNTLTVEKKGRGNYKLTLDAPNKGDGVTCKSVMMVRSILGMQIKTTGERAKADNQVGSVIDYSQSVNNLGSQSVAAYSPYLCALGLDAYPGAATLTFGTLYKLQGRTATLTPDDAIAVGSFLVAR